MQFNNKQSNQSVFSPLIIQPGIKRDGTDFEGQFYTDGEWVRFHRGKPRKMGGYRLMSSLFPALSRGCHGANRQGQYYVHSGSSEFLNLQTFDSSGIGGTFADRTPSGFVTSSDNLWTFAIMYDATTTNSTIIAHAAPNLSDMDNATAASAYYGNAYTTAALAAISSSSVSGGVCVLHPYLFVYGSDGYVGWSVPNKPQDLTNSGSGAARVCSGKVVYGTATRGGSGNNPSGLFFATDALVRCNFIGGSAIFNFDTITDGYSILSSRGVVEYDGLYYWPGTDRFLQFNGVVRELMNDLNGDDFFENLNYDQRQKVWGIKVPRYGEIWWFYPRGMSTECNHAIIYNVRSGSWYDTPIGRVAGFYTNLFRYPVMFDDQTDGASKTQLWMHEFGYDKVVGETSYAIESYFTTCDLSFASTGITGQELVGQDVNVMVDQFLPDFRMSGDMQLDIIGRQYPQSPDTTLATHTFNNATESVETRSQSRNVRFKFTSNVAGGTYQMGQPMLELSEGDSRV